MENGNEIDERKSYLISLIQLSADIYQIKRHLELFPWDSEGAIHTLTKKDVLHVFTLFFTNQNNVQIIEDWSNIIECREDIDFEDDIVRDVIIELANPILYGQLSISKLNKLKSILEHPSIDTSRL